MLQNVFQVNFIFLCKFQWKTFLFMKIEIAKHKIFQNLKTIPGKYHKGKWNFC